MNLKEAIATAEKYREDKVCNIYDCNDKWLFDFESNKGDVSGFLPLFVYKDDGRVEQLFFGECFDIVYNSKPIPFPK